MTDMMREEFERICGGDFTRNPYPPKSHEYRDHETQIAWEAWQAAKADELEFLENLVEHVDSFIWKRIDDRITELKKGESRG